jgi:hypothetical protein
MFTMTFRALLFSFTLLLGVQASRAQEDFETLLEISEGREVNESVEATRHVREMKKKLQPDRDNSERSPAEKPLPGGRSPAFPTPKASSK